MSDGFRRRRMPSGAIAAASLVLLSGSLVTDAAAAPRIALEQTHVIIPRVLGGEVVEQSLRYRNPGTATLQISRVLTGCDCLTARYTESVRPGETGTLTIRLITSPWAQGLERRQITLLTNDPDQPSPTIEVIAQVQPGIRLTPASPCVVSYRRGDVIRQTITVVSNADRPISITDIVPGGPRIQGRVLTGAKAAAAAETRIEVTFRPPPSGGDCSGSVALHTTHPAVPAVPFVIHAIDEDALTVRPSRISLGTLTQNHLGKELRVFTLSSRTAAFQILGVRTDAAVLLAEVRQPERLDPSGAANYHEIVIRYLGGWIPGKHTGKIVVTTDDPLAPTREVEYEAEVVNTDTEGRRGEPG